MDVSKVFMVRSAKDCDMLCVDGYLYHYDNCSKQTFSWVCNKRKDKQTPCRARIITTAKEEDLTKHTVRKAFMEHSHERCSSSDIEKAIQRKRIADMECKPSSLTEKLLKRKLEMSNHEPSKRRVLDGVMLDFENKNKVYLLRSHDQRQMLGYNGHLYRLDGKSFKNPIFRWQCIRHRDVKCKTLLYTELADNSEHQLKNTHQEIHNHEAYTPAKLRKLCQRHNIKVENSDVSSRLGGDNEFILFASDSRELGIDVTPEQEFESIVENVNSMNKRKLNLNTNKSNDPLCNVATTTATITKATAATTKTNALKINELNFSFLPSKNKSNNVLCIEEYLYHFDTKNVQNGHTYWSCTMRRDRDLKCNARAIMKSTKAGTAIVSMSGEHKHPTCNADIQRRQNMDEAIGKKAKTVRGAVLRSRETIQRGLKRLNEKLKSKSYGKLKSDGDESDLSLSSISDAFDSDDSDTTNLPTNIAAMRKKCVKKEKSSSETEQDDMVEEYLDTYDNWFQIEKHFLNEDEQSFGSNNNTDSADISLSSSDEFKQHKKRRTSSNLMDTTLDISKVSKLRSAKGGEQLCVDGYIYHVKSICGLRTYWSCIKCRDPILKCKARLTTVMDNENIRVVRTTNCHSHQIIEDDIKRRLYNEIVAHNVAKVKPTKDIISEKSLNDVRKEYTQLLGRSFDDQPINENGTTMKLYSVTDGPPSMAVRMTLKALEIPFELINVDFIAAEHMTEQYAKMNPQKEIPVLDDDGFYLPESIAIMQYLCDKYAPESPLYPKDAQQRAIINQRLCFNMGFYYASIAAHSMLPIYFDFERTDMSLKKTKNALLVLETYLQRAGTKYAAADHLTIADFALVSATLCLEAIDFDLSEYPLVEKWYQTFKKEYPEIWAVAEGGMEEIKECEKHNPDLSHMNHPFLPTRKPKA